MPQLLQQQREAGNRICAVIHDQHPQGSRGRRTGIRDRPFRLRGIKRPYDWQPHDELAALPHSTVSLDRSSVQFREPLYQSQSNPQSALRAVQRSLCLREQLQKMRQKCRGDADAAVAHANDELVGRLQPPAPAHQVDGQPDVTAFRGVLGGIVEQVHYNLFETRARRARRDHLRRQRYRKFMPTLFDQRLNGFHRMPATMSLTTAISWRS